MFYIVIPSDIFLLVKMLLMEIICGGCTIEGLTGMYWENKLSQLMLQINPNGIIKMIKHVD